MAARWRRAGAVAALCCLLVLARAVEEEVVVTGGAEGVPIDGTASDFLLATQFQATVVVTANQVEQSQDYPPRVRELEVVYDYVNGRGKVHVNHGFDMGKTFIRRYDQNIEYMVQGGTYPACERAHLGEKMPLPALSEMAVLVGDEVVNGVACYHWVEEAFEERTHVYVDKATRLPVKAVSAYLQADGAEVPLMTYEFRDASVNIQDTSLSAFQLPPEWSHDRCTRNQAGFPYLHLFHHYLRF